MEAESCACRSSAGRHPGRVTPAPHAGAPTSPYHGRPNRKEPAGDRQTHHCRIAAGHHRQPVHQRIFPRQGQLVTQTNPRSVETARGPVSHLDHLRIGRLRSGLDHAARATTLSAAIETIKKARDSGLFYGWRTAPSEPVDHHEQAQPHHVDEVPVPRHAFVAEM